MKIIPELKKIACLNDKIRRLAEKVEENSCLEVSEGLGIDEACLVTGIKKKNGHLYRNGCQLDNYGLVDDLYYCNQHQGYCEDNFYGTLYFATDVPGQYVAVPFDE